MLDNPGSNIRQNGRVHRRVGETFGRDELTLAQHHRLLDLELPDGADGGLRYADLDATGRRSGLSTTKGGSLLAAYGPNVSPTIAPKVAEHQPAAAAPHPAASDPCDPLDPDAVLDALHVDHAVADFDAWAAHAAPELARLLAARRTETP